MSNQNNVHISWNNGIISEPGAGKGQNDSFGNLSPLLEAFQFLFYSKVVVCNTSTRVVPGGFTRLHSEPVPTVSD